MGCGSRFLRFLSATFFAALALTGCMRHSATSGSFTYAGIDAQNFVLPPGLPPGNNPRLTIPIEINAPSHGHAACAIHQQWFSFYPMVSGKRVQWFVQTPSANAWAQSGGYVDMNAEWTAFLRALDGLGQNGCFASSNAPARIKQQIVASMPVPDQDALFYHYGFGVGGYIDLSTGMQLQIERILSKPVMDLQTHKVINLDQMFTAYAVVRGSENGVRLRLLRNGTYTRFESSTHPDVAAMDFPDRGLAAEFSAAPYLRLMLKTVVVSGNVDRPAILLGALDVDSLDAAANQLMAKSKTSCNQIAALPVTCAEFDGTISVGPKLGIYVNRHLVYVAVGNRLWSVLPRAPGTFKITAPATLRVQRKLGDQYADIRAGAGVENLSQLTLLEGDRISW